MFNGNQLLIEAFVERLEIEYRRNYGQLMPRYREIVVWAGRMALERIATTDALYHNVEHTIMVTLVGQEVLRGKHLREGGVSPSDWLHFMLSLFYHDIGYVRRVCQADSATHCSTGIEDELVEVPVGATDAFLTPYHVDRGIQFVRERFGHHDVIDVEAIVNNIRHTRFPTPIENDYPGTNDYPALVRAADLIGQLADSEYLRKLPALYYEFEEIGTNAKLGYQSPADLRTKYPGFFWNVVHPYVGDGIRYLSVTQEGRQWKANLYAHIFAAEHEEEPYADLKKGQ